MSSVANGCVCRRCWFMPGIPPGAKICAEQPSSSLEVLPLLPRPGATFPRVPLARGYPRGGLGKAAACSVSQAIQGSVLQPGLPAWPRSQLGSSPLTAKGTAEKASASACGSLPRSLLVALCLKHPAETPPWLSGACCGFCRVCSAATKQQEGSHPPGRHPGTTAPGSSPSPPMICE